MTPERWRRIGELFQSALDRDTESRDAFLIAACGGDEDLRAEVQSLLSAHDEAGTFGEAAAIADASEDPLTDVVAERTLQRGARLGPYEVVDLIAAGGMGEVYRARDARLAREVAIKVLPAASLSDAGRLRRFHQEALAAGALNHPNILAVYDVGTEGALPYVVSELLEGETLRTRLDHEGALPAAEAAAIARAVAEGLRAAHEKGIVHRDLKPANLFLTRDGRVKILDFGLSKRVAWPGASDGATSPTQPGVLLGTAGYMSPEQARGEPTGTPTDVFSFGAVLFEMLTGRRAFEARSAVETLTAILSDDPPFEILPADVPAPLVAVMRQCLEKDPACRFPSARELSEALAGAFTTAAVAIPRAAMAGSPAAERLAVLPFRTIGGDPEQEYFCEGLAEELIHTLSRLEGLHVVARTPPAVKGRQDSVQRIGRQLGVGKVVQGSVRRAGTRLRVAIQLVETQTAHHLWSERFDREAADLFALQDEIAEEVVDALQVRLGRGRAGRARRRPEDLEAYHLYLKGRYYWNKRHQGGLRKGARCFEQALEREPTYAAAHAGLADTYALLGIASFDALPALEAMPRARAAAEQALEIDDTLAEAYAARAWVRFHFDWDWTEAERDFRRALDLDPDRGTTHHWYSFFLSARGRDEEATAEAARAFQLDPLSLIIGSNLLQPPYYARRFDEALAQAERALELDPLFHVSHFWRGLARAALGRYEEAMADHEVFASQGGARTCALGLLAHTAGRAGRQEEGRRYLEELRALAAGRPVAAIHFAIAHAGLGDLDEAFAWLERAREERSDQMAYLAVEPLFDPLRGDPRYGELLQLLRLTPATAPAAAPRPRATITAPPPPASVAVLPFLNLDRDPEHEYLCDGLAEELIHALASVEGLRVAARTSSFQFKGGSEDLRRIGKRLGVGRVVEGSVRRVGSRLRITVQIVDAGSGYHVWSERFDRETGDVFALQDEIAARVVEALKVRLDPPSHPRPRPRDVQAYELYLRGRYFWNKRYRGELRKAVAAFEAAIARDPEFALAHAGLADACSVLGYYGLAPETEVFAQARRAAERALALDPRSPEAHVSIALVRDWFDWDLPAAEAALRRALALAPDHVPAHLYLAHVLGVQDRGREGLASARAGLERDPLSPLAHNLVATAFYLAGDDEEALRILEGGLELDPDYPPALLYVTLAESRRGRHEAAVAAARRGSEAFERAPFFESLVGWALARGGQTDAARDVLAHLQDRARSEYVPAIFLARVAAALDDRDRALLWLEEAVVQRNTWVVNLGVDPWPGVADHPRWRALMARAGLPAVREVSGARRPRRGGAAPSVAVLPFRDLSSPPDGTNLGLGLADATITELARLGSLLVRPTSAVLRYQSGTHDPQAAGQELGVDTIVEGSFQRSGERVRVTVQLVTVGDGRPLWGTKLDASLSDVFGMQDEVSGRIAAALRVELSPPERARAAPSGRLPRAPTSCT